MSKFWLFKPSPPPPPPPPPDLDWLIASHEAGHGISAYHLKFPVLGLVLHDTPGGKMEPDNVAVEVAWKYMSAILKSAERPLTNMGAMLRMGWAVNRIVQGAEAAKEHEYSGGDIAQIEKLFTDRHIGADHIAYLNGKIWERCQQIIGLPGFNDALNALATELIKARRLNPREIAAIIEGAVGNTLRSGKDSQPPEDLIRRNAFYLWKEKGEENGNDLYYWYTAEKGLRFAFENAH